MTSSFGEYYENLYGKRWQNLRESLLLPAITVPYTEGLTEPYFLDSASILAACSLRLPLSLPVRFISQNHACSEKKEEASSLILDACAAPGGKSLIIASRMKDFSALLSNELSGERRRRLAAVLDKHLPIETRNRVKVSGFDAAKTAGRQTERNRFASILMDVPCSSERHVLRNKTELEKWTPARPRFLAQRQWSLLSAAFLMLSSSGSLVYSTCSLNPQENDGIAKCLLKKYGDSCVLDRPDFSQGEETEYGKIILPDVSAGCGPMYVARFIKR